MDLGAVIGLVISLVFTLLSVVFTGVIVLVSLAVPLAITGIVTFVIVRQLQSGNATIMVSGPAAALLAAATTPASTAKKRLKKVVCHTCGGSKLVLPKTAYVYCDYCSTLVDWDFQIACKTAGSARPGPAYEALVAGKAPSRQKAKDDGDRELYSGIGREIYDAHFTACPASWSPRLKDPDYREALLEVTVAQDTAAAFDSDCATLAAVMGDAVKKLQWIPAFPQPMVERKSFDLLLEAVLAHNARYTELAEPLLDRHPDSPTVDLQRRIARSAFAQGWMSYLDKGGQTHMIERLELGGEYIDVPDTETTERHCAGCAKSLRVVAGARKVVCEDCGHCSDVSQPEITCTGCGGPISVRWSKRRFDCPSCATELRVD